MMYIQQKITRRAIELLALPKGMPAVILDIGCGSGLSGQVLEDLPHVQWIGLDISKAMLGLHVLTVFISISFFRYCT